MKCETCIHNNVCKYQEAYEDYCKKVSFGSENADKFKVTVDCVVYHAQSCTRPVSGGGIRGAREESYPACR